MFNLFLVYITVKSAIQPISKEIIIGFALSLMNFDRAGTEQTLLETYFSFLLFLDKTSIQAIFALIFVRPDDVSKQTKMGVLYEVRRQEE